MFTVEEEYLMVGTGDLVNVKGIIEYNENRENYEIYYINEFHEIGEGVLRRVKKNIFYSIKMIEKLRKNIRVFSMPFYLVKKDF